MYRFLSSDSNGRLGNDGRFALCILLGFPISFAYRWIPNQFRHFYSIVTSCTILYTLFSPRACFEIVGLCLSVYAIGKIGLGKASTPYLIFGVSLSWMAYVHLESQFLRVDDPDFVDYSTAMMILLIKLSSFGWSAFDAGRVSNGQLDEYQKNHAIKEYPSLIEFFGYCLFFNGFFVGPAIEYNHYHQFTRADREPYKSKQPTFLPMMKCLVFGLFMFAVDIYLSPTFHFLHLVKPWFLDLGFVQKVGYLLIAGVVSRAKFYAVWNLSESAALMSGVGVGLDEKGKVVFNAFENLNFLELEFAENPKAMLDAWNKFTARWLRRYVYVRTDKLKLLSTFLISAVWHGFYPGYYLSFLSTVPLNECGRTVRRNLRPLFLPGSKLQAFKPLYDILGVLVSKVLMDYMFLSFFLRRFDYSITVWRNFYFFGHFMIIIPILALEWLKVKTILHPRVEKPKKQ